MTSSDTTPRAIVIVGPGRVGRSLCAAAMAVGIDARLLGRRPAGPDPSLDGSSVLLTVPDAAIEPACRDLIAAGSRPARIGHASGATGLAALDAAAAAGVATFSLHPLQTVPNGETDLSGAGCAVTSEDPPSAEWAWRLALALGMEPFTLADRDRAAYHAAASIASNFLIALEESAAELLERIEIRDGRRLLAPLVSRTAANWAAQGAAALTGPIVRGDEATVAAHREALNRRAPELLGLYGELARRTQALAAAGTAAP